MKKKFLAFLIICMILLAQFSVFASEFTNSADNKITDELKQVMDNTSDDEYISIYIWLYDYGDEFVYAHLSSKLDTKITSQTEESYIKEMTTNKVQSYKLNYIEKELGLEQSLDSMAQNMNTHNDISDFRKYAEISNILSDKEIIDSIENGKSYEEIIELHERNDFLSKYRGSRLEINKAVNDNFADKLNYEKCQNIYIDKLLNYVKLECKKDYITNLSNMKEVKEIGFFDTTEKEIAEKTESSSIVENATNISDNKYILQPTNTGFTGSGIKVGVIENVGYDSDAMHLTNANITNRVEIYANYNSHATMVLSILCGQPVEIDGVKYQGVAPNANVFCGRVKNSTVAKNLYWLIVEKNVSIINCSFSYDTSANGYINYDQFFDCLVQQYRVVIVCAAGNETNITHPGMAYNIITVGNMSTTIDSYGKYVVNQSSSYQEELYLTNKPDIVAFGTNVHMVYDNEIVNFGSGTSFAAPMVSGTIALMMEANPTLIGKPDAIKAILVNGADGECVSVETTTDENGNVSTLNNIVSPYISYDASFEFVPQIREKTGAGLLNTEAAVSMAISNLLFRYGFDTTKNLTGTYKKTNKFYFEANQTLEFSLVFEKPFDNIIGRYEEVNFDLLIELCDENGETVMVTTSAANNVESFRATVKESGYYYFVIGIGEVVFDEDAFVNINEIELFTHNTHNMFYASFVLSCGCEKPVLNVSNNDITCANCSFACNKN